MIAEKVDSGAIDVTQETSGVRLGMEVKQGEGANRGGSIILNFKKAETPKEGGCC
jgi:hypothetical protein